MTSEQLYQLNSFIIICMYHSPLYLKITIRAEGSKVVQDHLSLFLGPSISTQLVFFVRRLFHSHVKQKEMRFHGLKNEKSQSTILDINQHYEPNLFHCDNVLCAPSSSGKGFCLYRLLPPSLSGIRFPVSGRESACNAGDMGSTLRSGRSPQKEMVTCSSILAWGIPWTKNPGGLQSMGSQRVGHDLATEQQQKTAAQPVIITGQHCLHKQCVGFLLSLNLIQIRHLKY